MTLAAEVPGLRPGAVRRAGAGDQDVGGRSQPLDRQHLRRSVVDRPEVSFHRRQRPQQAGADVIKLPFFVPDK
jgi:hypothetical protein